MILFGLCLLCLAAVVAAFYFGVLWKTWAVDKAPPEIRVGEVVIVRHTSGYRGYKFMRLTEFWMGFDQPSTASLVDLSADLKHRPPVSNWDKTEIEDLVGVDLLPWQRRVFRQQMQKGSGR